MISRVIPGATYGEGWPGGPLITSLSLPPGLPTGLLHFRVDADGRVVGQGAEGPLGGHGCYWDGNQWMDLGMSAGTSVGAFHPTSGEVYLSVPDGVKVFDHKGGFQRFLPGYPGSQGIRWVNPDGSIVSGDATYGKDGHIGEYMDLGGVLVGQGLHGGLDAVIEGHTKHLADGNCLFPRTNRRGDSFRAYFTDFASGYDIEFTLADLRALPDESSIPVPSPVSDPPTPHPTPVPTPIEVHMPIAPNRLDIVRAVFAAHPEINGQLDGERGQLTSLVVQALGGFPWGRKEKQKGTGVLSDDALCYRSSSDSFEIYDIQRGFNPGDPRVPNESIAQWNYAGTFKDGENGWFYTVSLTGQPPVVVPPTPPSTDHQAVVNLQHDLQTVRQMLQDSIGSLGETLNGFAGNLQTLTDKVHEIDQRVNNPAPTPAPRKVRTTSAGMGFLKHSHEVTI